MTTANRRKSGQQEYRAVFPDGTATAKLDSEPIGEGGAGNVFRATINNAPGIGGPSQWAAKVYHPDRADRNLYEKILYMIDNQVKVSPPNRIAQPKAMLFDHVAKKPTGFLMELLSMDQWKPLVQHYNPQASQQEQNDAWEQRRWRIARNLSQALEDIHQAGHAAGDLSETNTLANAQGAVALIDADGWQVNGNDLEGNPRNWNCTIARSEYTPPEVSKRIGQLCNEPDCPRNAAEGKHSANQSCIPRTAEHDSYILGILVFKLLMKGEEPFGQGSDARHLPHGSPTVKMAQMGLFRYGSKHYNCCGPRNKQARESWEKLPQQIRRQLEQALTPPETM